MKRFLGFITLCFILFLPAIGSHGDDTFGDSAIRSGQDVPIPGASGTSGARSGDIRTPGREVETATVVEADPYTRALRTIRNTGRTGQGAETILQSDQVLDQLRLLARDTPPSAPRRLVTSTDDLLGTNDENPTCTNHLLESVNRRPLTINLGPHLTPGNEADSGEPATPEGGPAPIELGNESPPIFTSPDGPVGEPVPPSLATSQDRDVIISRNLASTGRTPVTNHNPSQPVPDYNLSILNRTSQIAVEQGIESSATNTLSRSVASHQRRDRQAYQDEQQIDRALHQLPVSELQSRLSEASREMAKALDSLKQVQGADKGQLNRISRTLLNAKDLADLGNEVLRENQTKKVLGGLSNIRDLFSNKGSLARSSVPELNEILRPADSKDEADSADSLTRRMLKLYTLPKNKRQELLSQLNLGSLGSFSLSGGSRLLIPLLNGRKLASTGRSDCVRVLNSLVDAGIRKDAYTTLDYRSMWIYIKERKLPEEPTFTQSRGEEIKKASAAFDAVDLYAGETIIPGDLILLKLPWDPKGSVYYVKSFDRHTMVAQVVSDFSKNSKAKPFALSLDPKESKKRYIRPGLMALRIRKVKNPACTFDPKKVTLKEKNGKTRGYVKGTAL